MTGQKIYQNRNILNEIIVCPHTQNRFLETVLKKRRKNHLTTSSGDSLVLLYTVPARVFLISWI